MNCEGCQYYDLAENIESVIEIHGNEIKINSAVNQVTEINGREVKHSFCRNDDTSINQIERGQSGIVFFENNKSGFIQAESIGLRVVFSDDYCNNHKPV